MTFSVQSEVGQLRQAIVHRPGLELSRLTPRNIGELLFDDVLWASKAKEEHDVFAEILRDHGVRVHYFGQLLAETLELPAGRAYVLDRVCTPEILGPALVSPLRELFADLDGPRLAEYLTGGVLRADLRPLRAKSLKWDMLRADDFLLSPLPNHLFTRDNSCWVYGGRPSASSGTTGNSYLAVAPGVILGYDRNVATNTMLRKHGIEVIDVPGPRPRPDPRQRAAGRPAGPGERG